ncbi:MAG: CdaR family protein [Bacilli bacterium]
MKKKKKIKINIFKPIAKIFIGLWKLIDKYLILPITKLIVVIANKLTKNSKGLEKVISSTNALILVSLFIALITFFVVDTKVNTFIESSAEVLYNQPVNAVYNEEAYVIEGLPDTVDITLIGRRSDLYLAKQLPAQGVAVDLTGLKTGTHKVTLKYTQSVTSIDYKLDPSFITIIIYPKISETRTLTVDVLNQDKLDSKLVIDKVEITRNDVIIKGAEHKLKEVATVKALVDINNIIDPKEGTMVLKDIPLIAYDENGTAVDVELVPSKVSANITIKSPHKEVPIKIVPVGKVSFGKAIDLLTSDETNVTIYGSEEILAGINYIPINVDVEGLKGNKEYNVTIEKPVGINAISVTNATVNVTLGDEITREIENVHIDVKNLDSDLSVLGLSAEDTYVTVIVKGTQSVLDNLKATEINAYIDLEGYNVGNHEVDVVVTGNDLRVNYAPKIKKVNIQIEK